MSFDRSASDITRPAPESSRKYSISGFLNPGFKGTEIAPIFIMARWASRSAGHLSMARMTRSPLATPISNRLWAKQFTYRFRRPNAIPSPGRLSRTKVSAVFSPCWCRLLVRAAMNVVSIISYTGCHKSVSIRIKFLGKIVLFVIANLP